MPNELNALTMTAAIKEVLLNIGGQGTVSFLVGAEQRSIHGYPLVMAHRSKLMAATDWTSSSKAYHLLATQQLDDDQWKLFQALWLYTHGDDQAFNGVTLAGATAEQLRGYVGVEDCLAFRLATQQPLTITHEVDRADESLHIILQRVLAVPEDQRSEAVTEFDTAVREASRGLYDELLQHLSYAEDLTLPLGGRKVWQSYTTYNYKGRIASLMPPHVRKWVNDNHVQWSVVYQSDKRIAIGASGQRGVVQATVSECKQWNHLTNSDMLLVPKVADVYNEQHVIAGLARGMLYIRCCPK